MTKNICFQVCGDIPMKIWYSSWESWDIPRIAQTTEEYTRYIHVSVRETQRSIYPSFICACNTVSLDLVLLQHFRDSAVASDRIKHSGAPHCTRLHCASTACRMSLFFPNSGTPTGGVHSGHPAQAKEGRGCLSARQERLRVTYFRMPWIRVGQCLWAERKAVALSRGETHVSVHWTFINLMNGPNVETLIFLVPASNHFMFRSRSFDEMMSLRMDNDYKT